MSDRIAVVLCTRNGSAFIGEQLRSILFQQRLPDELILCDDASDDDTVAIAREALRAAPIRVQVLENEETLGVAANFESALRRTTAEIVALCDQDDCWRPAKLDRLAAAMADTRVVAAFSDGALVDDNGSPLPRTLWRAHGVGRRASRRLIGGQVLDQLLRWNVVTGATLAMRQSVLEVALPIPERTLHDEWLALIAAGLGPVVAIPDPLIDYRVHDASTLGLPPHRLVSLATSRRVDSEVRHREAERYQEASERLRAAGRSEQAGAVAAKADFCRRRSALDSVHGRAASVARSLAAGRYHRLAHGLRSAAHDLAFGP